MKKFIALEIGDKNLNHKVKDIVTVYIPSEEKNYWEIIFTNGENIITTFPIYIEYKDDDAK